MCAWRRDPSQTICTQSAPESRVGARIIARRYSYHRTLADLPWGSCTVRLWLRVRRLFCDHVGCTRRIFTERLPGVIAPWARRTARLAKRLTLAGLSSVARLVLV